MGSFVKFRRFFSIILQLIPHYKCYFRSLVFAKDDLIQCYGNGRSVRGFSSSNSQEERTQIVLCYCIRKQSCFTVMMTVIFIFLWWLNPTWSGHSYVKFHTNIQQMFKHLINALWPNSKICVLLPLKSRGRRGCKHHFSFFFFVKGAPLAMKRNFSSEYFSS